MHFCQGDSGQVDRLLFSLLLFQENYSAVKEIYLAEDSSCSSLLRFIGLAHPDEGEFAFWLDLQADT